MNRFEMFLLTSAREYAEHEVTFVGFHWPMLAARIARLTHAPNLVVVYESGVVEDRLTATLSTSPSDLRSAVDSPYTGTSIDALYGWLGRGRVAKTMLEAPIVDRRGNVNTTVVGSYHQPVVRLPGSGGGTELGSLGRGLTLMCSSEKARSYPEAVDYITSPGYLHEPGDRHRYGYLPGSGPQTLITPLGRFTITDLDGVRPHALHPGVTVREVGACMPWLDLDGYKNYPVLSCATDEEAAAVSQVLREASDSHYLLPSVP